MSYEAVGGNLKQNSEDARTWRAADDGVNESRHFEYGVFSWWCVSCCCGNQLLTSSDQCSEHADVVGINYNKSRTNHFRIKPIKNWQSETINKYLQILAFKYICIKWYMREFIWLNTNNLSFKKQTDRSSVIKIKLLCFLVHRSSYIHFISSFISRCRRVWFDIKHRSCDVHIFHIILMINWSLMQPTVD